MAMNVFDFQLQPEVLESKLFLMLRLGTTGSSSVAYAFSRSLAVATIGFAARPAGWDRFEIAGIPRQVSFID